MEEYIDSREMEERIKELEDLAEDNELDEEDQEELKELLEIKEECLNYGWEHGINFIHELETENYFQELAEDCYSIDSPLNNYIDWEKWADDCLTDYSEIEIKGNTYYWREA